MTLLLLACAGENPPPPPPVTSSSFWRLTPGTYAEYDVSFQRGVIDPVSGEILVTTSNPAAYPIRVTNLAYPNGAVFRALGAPGETLTARGPLGGWLEASTGTFLGEAGNGAGVTLTPPEPLLTINPVPGEVLTLTTQPSDADPLVETYRTISIDALTSMPPQYVVKTTLVERPDTTPRAYTYEYDGELKRTVYGDVKSDGTVDATVWDRTAVGRNPAATIGRMASTLKLRSMGWPRDVPGPE